MELAIVAFQPSGGQVQTQFNDDTVRALLKRARKNTGLFTRARVSAHGLLRSMSRLVLSERAIKKLIAKSIHGAAGWHITRKSMYAQLTGKLASYDGPNKACLAISDSKFFGEILGLKACAYTEANYPEHDMIALRFPEEAFDFCVSDQVLEHVEGDPFVAFKETVRVMKKGGLVVHTSCFINPVHGVPKDFWRYTTDALKLLATSSGCEVIEVGSWGNRESWALIHAGFRNAKLPDDPSHPLYQLAMRHEPAWPIVTWVIARKLD